MADTEWVEQSVVVPWGSLSGTWDDQTKTWNELNTDWTMGQGLAWEKLYETWATIDVTWGSL
jgi:hypothetical protein